MEGKLGSLEYAREEMRAAIAGILIGAELKIGHHFGHQAAYMNNFVKILDDDSFEIDRAALDAQKVAKLLPGVSQKRERNRPLPPARDFRKAMKLLIWIRPTRCWKPTRIEVSNIYGGKRQLTDSSTVI